MLKGLQEMKEKIKREEQKQMQELVKDLQKLSIGDREKIAYIAKGILLANEFEGKKGA